MKTEHTLCAWFGGCNRVAEFELTNYSPSERPDTPWEPFCRRHLYPAVISFSKSPPVYVRVVPSD